MNPNDVISVHRVPLTQPYYMYTTAEFSLGRYYAEIQKHTSHENNNYNTNYQIVGLVECLLLLSSFFVRSYCCCFCVPIALIGSFFFVRCIKSNEKRYKCAHAHRPKNDLVKRRKKKCLMAILQFE